MCGGELQKQDKEEEGKDVEGRSKYTPDDSQCTLWVSQVSLSAAAGVTEIETMGICI